MFPPLVVADCNIITRAFERGANFCATEESVFAMMTPMLVGMRAQARSFAKLANATEAVFPTDDSLVVDSGKTSDKPAPLSSVTVTSPNAIATFGETQSLPNRPTQKKGSGITPADVVGAKGQAAKVINDCIPCEFRIELAGDLFKKIWEDIKQQGLYYLEYFKSMLQQLRDLMKFWDMDKYNINLCNLWKFFTETICLPDFRRIIAMFMALLVQMAIEINSVFDIILMLAAPLLLPFLISLIAPLEQMLLMIIKPIDCIINAIIAQIQKLDYGAIFDVKIPTIKFGPRGLKKDQSIIKTTTFDSPLAQSAIDKLQSWGGEISPSQIDFYYIQGQRAELARAEAELDIVRRQGQDVDMQNLKARTEYQKELDAARAKTQQARKNLDQTKIQQASEKIREVQKSIQDAFGWVLKYINLAKQKVTEYVNMIFEEIKKIMESFLGSNGTTILKLWDKLQILQLIALILSVIDFIMKKKSCKDDENAAPSTPVPGTLLGTPLGSKDVKIWTDDNGVTHIEEDPGILTEALNVVAGAVGTSKTGPDLKAKVIEGGSSPLDETRQRVKSLIELTGDPVLDTTIARAVDSITTPMKLEFKCPLQTSVTDAGQVNKWIAELSGR